MIQEYNAVEDKWSGRMYNTHINAEGLQLDSEKVYGDYLYEIELDQEYCARNWIEKSIKPVNEELELQWKDSHFVWGSEQAKRRLWFPLGVDDLYNSWTEIAVASEEQRDLVGERVSLNGTLISQNSVSPESGYGVPKYGENRFEKGLLIDGSCRPKWKNLDIEKKFSMSFTLYTPNDSTHSYTLLTLKNDEDYLHLHYRASDDKFVVSLSNGTEFSLADFSGREDYLHFMISQGDGYFTFVIYSLAYDSYVISRKKYTDLKVYNQLALYKDLGGYNAS
jgi:hypothetical protein